MRDRVRNNRQIVLNVRSNDVLSVNSSILNRLITLILIKNNFVKLHVGELNEIKRISDKSLEINIGGDISNYSRVVIRHGPNIVKYFKKTFKSNKPFVDACDRDLNGKIKNLNLTGKLNKKVNLWYARSTSSTEFFKTESKSSLSYCRKQPWLVFRESLRDDVLNKLSNLFCCPYIYPHTIRSIEKPLKGETVMPDLVQHLKTNDPNFSKYHLKMENFLTSREELSGSTDIQSFFVTTKSFDCLFNYFANIKNILGRTATLCGEKGSGKTVSVHHALNKNHINFEKNKVIVICSDIHILYRFWENYKAETRNTTVIDYNNFTFFFDLCNALNNSNNKTSKLLDNINAEDLTISDYPLSRNNPDSFKEPEPPLLEKLEEIIIPCLRNAFYTRSGFSRSYRFSLINQSFPIV